MEASEKIYATTGLYQKINWKAYALEQYYLNKKVEKILWERIEQLEARVAAADKLFDKLNGKYVDYTLTQALAAYESTKEQST